MGKRKLQGRTVDQLAERFAELVLLAENGSDAEAAGLGNEIQDIEDELKARGPDHHMDLLSLAMHSDETVRLEAMAATLRMMTGNPEVDARLVQQVAVATNAPFLQRTSSELHVPRMSREILGTLTTEELVERFVAIGLAQDDANLYGEFDKYNCLYDQMEFVEAELKSREGDQRCALLPLCEHNNLQVQLKAALATLAVAPEASRDVLQKLSDSNRYPEAASARGMLRALDNGTYTPS